MKYVTFPSLGHFALVKSCYLLWSNNKITNSITKFLIDNATILSTNTCWIKTYEWFVIERMVKEKIESLDIPETLKQKLIDITRPLGLDIATWSYHNKKYIADPEYFNECLKKLVWSPFGTIDFKLTAKLLISGCRIELLKSFELACMNCIEEDILRLFDEIPTEEINSYYQHLLQDRKKNCLLLLWCYKVRGHKRSIHSDVHFNRFLQRFHEYGFACTILEMNRPAAEFFFTKLTAEQRDKLLVELTVFIIRKSMKFDHPQTTVPVKYSEILCFMLSVMTASQIEELLSANCFNLLLNFIEWPWHNVFLEITKKAWNYLTEEEFCDILSYIVSMRHTSCCREWHIYDSAELFQELWQQSPYIYRKNMIKSEMSKSIFMNLLYVDDRGSLSVILRDASVEEKEYIIFHYVDWKIVYLYNWQLLIFMLKICIQSKYSMIRFRDKIKKSFIYDSSKDKWNFLNLLDKLVLQLKTKPEDDKESVPAKRLCIEQEQVLESS